MSGQGTGGSGFNGGSQDYPGVPFSSLDFHQPYCDIQNYGNADEVRNCYLVGLNDLDGGKDYVRQKIADYFNDLINIGVKGFRVDARYGIKLAECIRGGDFNCLGGIYDSNWGMADGMHAVVFVDNHDNQRGHGGAGGVLTASGPDHNDR